MTLRQRLALHYGVVVLIALILLGELSYHEFCTEERLRAALGPDQQSGTEWGEVIERVIYAIIPVVLVTGWWVTRRSLLPLTELARSVRAIRLDHLRNPLPRSGNNDEVHQLTEAFNSMTARLDQSFQRIRGFTLQVSHELKTPLTVMRGEIESIMELGGPVLPQQRERMDSLLDEIGRLAKIVDGLTFLAKEDSGKVMVKREPVRLSELVRESYEDALILAEAPGVQVTLTKCAEIVILGDRQRLRQLLVNLTDNAVKYNKPGGTVTMELRRVDGAVEIEIVNTGIAITPNLQARLFEPFVRGDEARARGIDGCGLGLSIARSIARAQGGSLRICSQPGDKTAAVLRLPLGLPSP
jgi:signal transduction histidine kinase